MGLLNNSSVMFSLKITFVLCFWLQLTITLSNIKRKEKESKEEEILWKHFMTDKSCQQCWWTNIKNIQFHFKPFPESIKLFFVCWYECESWNNLSVFVCLFKLIPKYLENNLSSTTGCEMKWNLVPLWILGSLSFKCFKSLSSPKSISKKNIIT